MDGATLTIEKGTTIKFEKNSDEDILPGIFVNDGKIIAKGAKGEEIKFTSDQDDSHFMIGIDDKGDERSGRTSFFRYVEISKGGDVGGPIFPVMRNPLNLLIETAYADSQQYVHVAHPAMAIGSGNVHIENSSFSDNNYIDVTVSNDVEYDDEYNVIKEYKPTAEIVNSNFLDDNALYSDRNCMDYDVGRMNQACLERVYLKNNYYNYSAGPTERNSLFSKGSRIGGAYKLDSFRTKELIIDPAIIVPGIMGSAMNYGEWQMDPILHTYDNLIESLKNNGYEENKNLFKFPYNWENDNRASAVDLQNKVENIISETKVSKVDIAAHSMGGLVARAYIEEVGEDDSKLKYNNTVNKLITFGTPEHGAPLAYLYWEAGEGFFGIDGYIAKHHFAQEAWHRNHSDLYSYIQEKVPSIKELLPDYGYLKDATSGNEKSYSNGYPKNTFLEDLNDPANLEKLGKVDLIDIVGKLDEDNSTISKIRVTDQQGDDGKWQDGMPQNWDDKSSDRGLEYLYGDGTVPLHSSESIGFKKEIIKKAAHRDLPDAAQCDIFEELTGRTNCAAVHTWHVPNILLINVFSPIDIQVIYTDENNRKSWAGKNIMNFSKDDADEIAGAFYSGADLPDGTKNPNEFVTIPNPKDGEYKVVMQKTGEGKYTVEMSNISEDGNNFRQATESVAKITGTTTEEDIPDAIVTVSGTQVSTEAVDTTPPTITATVTPEPNENGWNNTDVTVHFDAADEEGGSGLKSVTPDVTLSDEGENQTVTGTAEDNAGNTNSASVEVSIDKAAPVTTADPAGTKGKDDWYVSPVTVNFSATDNLSKVDQTFYVLDGDDKETGNALTISTNGTHKIEYYSTDKAGNREEAKILTIKIDQTVPTVAITSPENKTYKNTGMLPIKFQASDNLAATKNLKTEAELDGNATDASYVDLSLLNLGAHTLSALATDQAGNTSEKAQVDFSVGTDINSISKNIPHYYHLGLIKNRWTEFFLEIKLRNIQESMRLLDAFSRRWMPRWAKDRVIQNLKRNINRQIENLERQLERNRGLQRSIDPKVRGILVEDLESLSA